jgi:UDP-N-acetylglucosamine 2-epimerase
MSDRARCKVLSIVGTRPEAIKMAPVVAELRRHPTTVEAPLCATGQHRELLAQPLALFGLAPDHDLGLMTPNQDLAALTSRLFEALDRVVDAERPDWVLVQGDTTTAMVGAMVAFYRRLRVGHVEAGLRTGDLTRPFPEELNRRIADACASVWFAPTPGARNHLVAEGCRAEHVFVTGNTVVDAVLDMAARAYDPAASPLAAVPAAPRWVLVTAHRRENFGAPLGGICTAVDELARAFPRDVQFIVPVHPNPHVASCMRARLTAPNCSVVAPLDYDDVVHILKRAALVLTDSGGLQEEAPTFGVPVLVLREKTERPEGVAAGVCTLVGTDPEVIVAHAEAVLRAPRVATRPINPYGDGRAARRIVARLRAISGAVSDDDPAGSIDEWRPA